MVCKFSFQVVLRPSLYPTDVLNILMETGGFVLSGTSTFPSGSIVWNLTKWRNRAQVWIRMKILHFHYVNWVKLWIRRQNTCFQFIMKYKICTWFKYVVGGHFKIISPLPVRWWNSSGEHLTGSPVWRLVRLFEDGFTCLVSQCCDLVHIQSLVDCMNCTPYGDVAQYFWQL